MPIYVYCQGMGLGDGVDGLDTPNYAVMTTRALKNTESVTC